MWRWSTDWVDVEIESQDGSRPNPAVPCGNVENRDTMSHGRCSRMLVRGVALSGKTTHHQTEAELSLVHMALGWNNGLWDDFCTHVVSHVACSWIGF